MVQDFLKDQFNYDKETGKIYWKKLSKIRTSKDGQAGYINTKGYRVIGFRCKNYLAHRLIWYLVYGYFPEGCIDHINGNKSDNRLSNLREVSTSCNLKNSGNFRHNTSGVKGVTKKRNKFVASIKSDGVTITLGSFSDFIEAVAYRLALEECLGWNTCTSMSPAKAFMIKYLNEK